jgi:2-polyprenyl-6-methoxyphenol hydroxylase-like FAD-dependent oxidoreductase
VDCTGRRSPIVAWLSAIGAAAPAEERADCGVVYYGRHFRGAEMPPQSTSYTQHHPSVTLLTLPTDHVTWSVAIATSSRDHALRALRSPAAWHAVAALYPTVAPWAAGEPVGDVFVMAGIEDRHRCLVVDEVPVATGVVLVGDSWAATNPSVGRGAAMALLHARALRDTLRKADLPDVPAAFHAATMESVEPIYRATTWHDTHRLAEMDADIAGVPYAPDDPRWTMSCALYAAAPKDPDLTRAYAAVGGMLTTPSEVFASPGVAERVLALAGPRYPDSPSRADLLAAVGG